MQKHWLVLIALAWVGANVVRFIGYWALTCLWLFARACVQTIKGED